MLFVSRGVTESISLEIIFIQAREMFVRWSLTSMLDSTEEESWYSAATLNARCCIRQIARRIVGRFYLIVCSREEAVVIVFWLFYW